MRYDVLSSLEILSFVVENMKLIEPELQRPHAFSRGGGKLSRFRSEGMGIDGWVPSHDLQRNSLMGRQSKMLAVCVSRLFVTGSCKLNFPSLVPPTMALPHFGCVTSVPRLIP